MSIESSSKLRGERDIVLVCHKDVVGKTITNHWKSHVIAIGVVSWKRYQGRGTVICGLGSRHRQMREACDFSIGDAVV